MTEVERYYIEQTLALTNNNREEAAKLLGIGERTLYRNIKEWKVQDRVKQALTDSNGDVEAAAKALGMTEKELQRKLKRWGMRDDPEE